MLRVAALAPTAEMVIFAQMELVNQTQMLVVKKEILRHRFVVQNLKVSVQTKFVNLQPDLNVMRAVCTAS